MRSKDDARTRQLHQERQSGGQCLGVYPLRSHCSGETAVKVECCFCRRKIGERGSRFLLNHIVQDVCPNCFRRYYPKEDLLSMELYCFICGREGKHFIDEFRDHWEFTCRNCGGKVLFGKGSLP